MDFTNLTKTIGDTIANIKNNNKLVDELNKKFNPTFVEIIESLLKTDQTLAKMLMVWYMENYSIDNDQLTKLVNKYQVKKTSSNTYNGCGSSNGGCGYSSGRSYSGGCGSSSTGGC